MNKDAIERAKEKFGKLLEQQLARVEKIKKEPDWVDYAKMKTIRIGILPGDGIGPFIAKESAMVLRHLLAPEVKSGKVFIADIEGFTIERRAAENAAIPPAVMEEIRTFDVTLKGPTTTPRKGDPWPNIESCNVAVRKELDLFANIRPVRVPREGIDWMFFRENTEGAYAMGSSGVEVTDDLAIDFTVATTQGSDRLIRAAFEYAKKAGRKRVTIVTKANVIKTTDGKFLSIGQKIAKDYPGIEMDDWYIDIMTAKLVDTKRRNQFQVLALPNLYGDILTDEAAEFQGGVGTAGSGNIGKRYAMFEAIHGSAPRMVDEGRAQFADPCSMIRAAAMLIRHIGYGDRADKLEMALDVCGQFEKKLVMTGRSTGATGNQFCKYLMETMENPDLKKRWEGYMKA
ncbi:MAG: isocitrate/isopropylmalate dehydrogenase family protein [Candidatus Wallbacteria bacterium]|nr:isocitrate/isopropylmalate dehydrogenase family protein [Candidatus Wallbacteria bacterium]